MKTYQIIKKLEEYNEWRQYDGEVGEGPPMPKPKEVGIAIQEATLRLQEYLHYEEESQREIKDLERKVKYLETSQLDFESKLRSALEGDKDSELFGEEGLLAATMRCVYAVRQIGDTCNESAMQTDWHCRECGRSLE